VEAADVRAPLLCKNLRLKATVSILIHISRIRRSWSLRGFVYRAGAGTEQCHLPSVVVLIALRDLRRILGDRETYGSIGTGEH
jgi:hypothetical protein